VKNFQEARFRNGLDMQKRPERYALERLVYEGAPQRLFKKNLARTEAAPYHPP
jgi:hypothetical protein